ncbi:MAG: hypothetical protein WAN65_00400 [Candidatus Sulfotelmatobacter sp.]
MVWVIEYFGSPQCWISEPRGSGAFDVTFQRRYATQYTCREDAAHEMLRLGLSCAGFPQEVRKIEVEA